mgnify:CR=1 FL=1
MKKSITETNRQRAQRKRRAHAKAFGTAAMPRLTVFRSNRYLYAQLVDDERGVTIVSASTKADAGGTGNKTAQAEKVGEVIAGKAAALKVQRAMFDKGSYRYHGRVKAVAEGARKGGLRI